ncbi:MAG: hypothetical protein K2H32_10150 [Muribaculaceae bacterium]|nr:hypothetical protein [Muribaculaceae bacterium]
MKSLKYILVISALILLGVAQVNACGPYYPDDPNYILMFRSCSPELERQWQEGCRFQDFEKVQNCILWQDITSSSIPLSDIEKVIYGARLSNLNKFSTGNLSDNEFAKWLSDPNHREDLEYICIAKEIEEIREYMNNPWYYAYDGDDEHSRLTELKKICQDYNGKRHASRYALQLIRLHFAVGDYKSCIDLWENRVSKMPQNIVTDMIASYVGGAYSRQGNRAKAIELFTKSQDIGSLISLKAWQFVESNSIYTDERVKELEYIFNRFPNSPLLSVKLQEYIRNRELFVYNYEDWGNRGFHDPVPIKTYWVGDSLVADAEPIFYNELSRFAQNVVDNSKCNQRGMWNYALSYLYFLDGDMNNGLYYLNRAEHSEATPFIKESIRAFRFLLNAQQASNSGSYLNKLQSDLIWLDEQMDKDVSLNPDNEWQYNNKLNWRVSYLQDVARKVLLGVVCPKMKQVGNTTLALQLANYASNRVHQLFPLFKAYHYGYDDPDDRDSYYVILTFDEYRKKWPGHNYFDWQNQFFELIYNSSADDAAKYAQKIKNPVSKLDRFLNERSYVDSDYIYDIVGTLYLREMNYKKAIEWLSNVSSDYQQRMNIAKDGYFTLDPFRFQSDKKHFISDSNNYKLRFAQEMAQLDIIANSDVDSNRKAESKIRYAIGLRNSYGKCWYLTAYGYNMGLTYDEYWRNWEWHTSSNRKGFKDHNYAQQAYKKVDALLNEAISEFTDPEKAAQAQLEMMNYATLMKQFPNTKAAEHVRTRCDRYYDYALEKR